MDKKCELVRIAKNSNHMAGGSAQHKQVPNKMVVAYAMVINKEEHTTCIQNTARN